MAGRLSQKHAGAYYTPDPVVSTLLNWAIREDDDRLLDPSCGDGRFIAGHRNAVGIEQDPGAISTAVERAPWALVHEGDFFAWAGETAERFECAAGNPPFIRYQTFKGTTRERALSLCGRHGAEFTGLASSWAPFLVATATLLKPGGRMAFVVPAEIGHAPYAAPLLKYLVAHFATVQIVAVLEKFFPELSEDCWLMYADGYGGKTTDIRFTVADRLQKWPQPPGSYANVPVSEWSRLWKRRLRPFLMPKAARDLYRAVADEVDTRRLGEIAAVGIGYVSGANEFFHLRPSDADKWGIPDKFLHASVRNGRALPAARLTNGIVEKWKREDEPVLLLRLPKTKDLPSSIIRYLNTDAGKIARTGYKCRNRDPWYSVPDVQIPDFFLSYMSGREPSFVRNDAGCTCTNSVHSVRIKNAEDAKAYLGSWGSSFVQLSCEIEGHPLGGGLLKLEPREATEILLPKRRLKRAEINALNEAIETMRQWRHYAAVA